MARDPFAGYDNWLVAPWEEAEEKARHDEEYAMWEWENSTWTCSCCGEYVEYSDDKTVPCPHCGDTEYGQIQHKPDPPVDEPDYDDYYDY